MKDAIYLFFAVLNENIGGLSHNVMCSTWHTV